MWMNKQDLALNNPQGLIWSYSYLLRIIIIIISYSKLQVCANDLVYIALDMFYGISTHVGYLMPNSVYTYLPTPPLGQDMTQGQF